MGAHTRDTASSLWQAYVAELKQAITDAEERERESAREARERLRMQQVGNRASALAGLRRGGHIGLMPKTVVETQTAGMLGTLLRDVQPALECSDLDWIILMHNRYVGYLRSIADPAEL